MSENLQTNVKAPSEIKKEREFKTKKKKSFPDVNTYHVTQTNLLPGGILLQYSQLWKN